MEYRVIRTESNGDELYHYGVKGMKWGVRRSLQQLGYKQARSGAGQLGLKAAQGVAKKKKTSTGPSSSQTKKQLTPEQKAAKRKKAIKIGAAVAGTALAAYGTYKLAEYMQQKRDSAALEKAANYVEKNFLTKVGENRYASGRTISTFQDASGRTVSVLGRGSKEIGRQNAKVVATGKRMYGEATNTKLDKGLSKIVGAGDSVGRTTKRAGDSVGRVSTNAKNRVLDVVNPLYEYVPGESNSYTRRINGMNVTNTVQNYHKRKIKR